MSTFVVSARKYRPQRFEDVVGQSHVSITLKNALQTDHLAHAFLFCGPRGVGKTTCARILAKTINCTDKSADFEPCNKCSSCQSFNDSASFNIVELDAASNNSVEHIRALIEQVRFQPQQGRYKVFIIDEVHMLSSQAFNAFLKTLEEPPPYAIFILATTEKHKIIPTILSRCQIFDFKRIQVPEMVAHLSAICKAEGIEADVDALHVIAQKADGALRDSLSIFDRIVSFSGAHISYDDVITNLNLLDYDYFFRFVDAMLAEDTAGLMLLFNEVVRNGFEPDIFTAGLGEHLRNLLLCKNEATLEIMEVSENLKRRYRDQSNLSSARFILNGLNLINQCDMHYKVAKNKRLLVEMTLLKMTFAHREIQELPATNPEKKNPELSHIAPSSAPKLATSTIEAAPTVSPSTVQEPKPILLEPTTPRVSAIVPPVNTKEDTLKSSLGNNGVGLTPKFDLASLSAHAKASVMEQTDQKESTPLSLERIVEAWFDYKEKASGAVKGMMDSAELSWDGQKMKITVATSLAANTITQETSLMEHMMNYLSEPNLIREIAVDGSRVQQTTKKNHRPVTTMEKYQSMVSINPVVQLLRDKLELLPEEDN